MGKSTNLRMIAGLESVTGGELLVGEKRSNDVRPDDCGAVTRSEMVPVA